MNSGECFGQAPQGDQLFAGGDGATKETAVVVNTDKTLIGVPAEYAYVGRQCGRPGQDWEMLVQRHVPSGGRHYDVLEVRMSSGEERSFWFDITSFFGRF